MVSRVAFVFSFREKVRRKRETCVREYKQKEREKKVDERVGYDTRCTTKKTPCRKDRRGSNLAYELDRRT